MQIDADTQTALALGIARLRSMRAIECLSALLAAAALAGTLLAASSAIVRTLLALSVVAAMVAAYSGIRVRIDVALFERWERLDVTALDQALITMNPNFQAARSLQSRIDGSLGWWRRGLAALAMQMALCLCALFWV